MRKRKVVLRFRGKYWFLSSFYPTQIVIDGVEYPTVEHYFQSMKATDPETAEKIRNLETPKKARRMGRRIKLRSDWEEIKQLIMRRAVYEKFTQHPELEKLLLETGDMILVEGNNWGKDYWGCVRNKEKKLVGQNHYGRILMEVRAYLRDVPPEERSFQDYIDRYAWKLEFDCNNLSNI